jgi:hypothetical protein
VKIVRHYLSQRELRYIAYVPNMPGSKLKDIE